MRIDCEPGLVERARDGDLRALEAMLTTVQRPVYNLALRMLGRREDAQDATQEILLKVTTHLATWRGDGPFGGWVLGVASHHLLNARTRSPARREVSFEALDLALEQGLSHAAHVGFEEKAASPEDLLEARRTALTCTQAMLMALDPPGRLAYVLDVIFGLDSPTAAAVQGIGAAAHRQRLSRARAALHGFMERRCGLVTERADCRCVRQVPAKRLAQAAGRASGGAEVADADLEAAEHGLRELIAMGDAAAVMRGTPQYAAPGALVQGIRRVVEQSSMLGR